MTQRDFVCDDTVRSRQDGVRRDPGNQLINVIVALWYGKRILCSIDVKVKCIIGAIYLVKGVRDTAL